MERLVAGLQSKGNLFVLVWVIVSTLITVVMAERAFGSGEGEPVVVGMGESLWTIAQTHNELGRDVRELVQAIQVTNHLQGSLLYPGQKLIVPAQW
ncbi:MAG TPA: LysM peptidoglycan-binding domain-containing protein [Bacilli bacterium]|nr:LysM peptidoglycan-binding domain-containing protein [Bacilli bacterium]